MAGRGPGGEGTSQQARKSVSQRGAGPPGGDVVRTLAPGGTGLLEGVGGCISGVVLVVGDVSAAEVAWQREAGPK